MEFLGRASVAVLATRDERLVPRLHFASGWYVHEDRASVVCLVPDSFAGDLATAFVPGGRIAMVAEVIGPHETYQLKGRCLDLRPAGDADHRIHEDCRQRFVTAVHNHLKGRYRADDLAARVHPPSIAVRFAVEEIFVQTPGPAAGRRVFPAEV